VNGLIKPVLYTTIILGNIGLMFMTGIVWSLFAHAVTGTL
jgi:hypothetical protein